MLNEANSMTISSKIGNLLMITAALSAVCLTWICTHSFRFETGPVFFLQPFVPYGDGMAFACGLVLILPIYIISWWMTKERHYLNVIFIPLISIAIILITTYHWINAPEVFPVDAGRQENLYPADSISYTLGYVLAILVMITGLYDFWLRFGKRGNR